MKKIVWNPGDGVFKYRGRVRFGDFFHTHDDDDEVKVDKVKKDTTYMIDAGEFMAVRADFADKLPFDCYGSYVRFSAENGTIEDVLENIRAIDLGKRVQFQFSDTGDHHSYVWVKVTDNGEDVALMQVYFDCGKPFFEKTALKGTMHIYGQKDYVKNAVSSVKEKMKHVKTPSIMWHYMSDGQHRMQELDVTTDVTIKDEYYPFIKFRNANGTVGGVNDFIADYLKSSESILILLGPPGTGKSTLLRNMIVENNLSAILTYEERLLQQDKLFINHLSNTDSDLLILEDADVLLESRESSGNHIMQKLLNVSDGIIKVMSKKIVFTTNLTSTKNIDDALLRPGRCYGVVAFREMTYLETCRAAEAAGLVPPVENRAYTLAEMFQNKSNIDGSLFKKRLGFV